MDNNLQFARQNNWLGNSYSNKVENIIRKVNKISVLVYMNTE